MFKNILLCLFILPFTLFSQKQIDPSKVSYGKENIDGVNIFYRESGNKTNQAIVLLHGFPSSSNMYQELLSKLGDNYYLIAPDYPSYGNSDTPSIEDYTYTFDNLSKTMHQFIVKKGIKNYVIVMHDFGGPVGFRIAKEYPSEVKGLVVMNANAYKEGVSDAVKGVLAFEEGKDDEKMKEFNTSKKAIYWLHSHGTRNPDNLNPDAWNLDVYNMTDNASEKASLKMLFDYKNNLVLYKGWQKYLRDYQPPMLVLWGKNDGIFTVEGAKAYKKDVKNVDLHLLDTGHYPIKEEASFIIKKMREFLIKL